jgi:hypothetical protein
MLFRPGSFTEHCKIALSSACFDNDVNCKVTNRRRVRGDSAHSRVRRNFFLKAMVDMKYPFSVHIFIFLVAGGLNPFSMLQPIYPNLFPLNRPKVG